MAIYLGDDQLNTKSNNILSINNILPDDMGRLTLASTDVFTTDAYGSNTNGSYQKFDNGLMICWKIVEWSNVAITTSWGVMYESGWLNLGDWPAAFIAAPALYVNQHFDTVGVGMFECAKECTATSAGKITCWRPTSYTIPTLKYFVLGVGRWK